MAEAVPGNALHACDVAGALLPIAVKRGHRAAGLRGVLCHGPCPSEAGSSRARLAPLEAAGETGQE